MKWNQPTPVLLFKDIELPDFSLVNYSVVAVEQMYPAGWWDELTVTFVFRRRYGWYILQGYIPTYLTIFISWISFYLGTKAIPARTMIGVNALLAMTFQFGNIIRNLPRVSYVKAIDVWMLSGMMFIFASLLELAVIGYMSRNDGAPSRVKPRRQSHEPAAWSQISSPRPGLQKDQELETTNPNGTMPAGRVKYASVERRRRGRCLWSCLPSLCSLRAERIDKYSAIGFPAAYFIFNCMYWGYYMTPISGSDDMPTT